MWIYFVIGILMFAVGFLVGVKWTMVKFTEAMDELAVEMKEDVTKIFG